MTMPVRLAFVGRMEDSQSVLSQPVNPNELNASHEVIEQEIAEQIAAMVGVQPTVSLKFDVGSIVWNGFVDFIENPRPLLDWMATISGSIALVQMVASVVNSVVKKWSKTLPALKVQQLNPTTQVFVLSAGDQPGPWNTQTIFGIAALCFSVATLVAAVAALVIAMKW